MENEEFDKKCMNLIEKIVAISPNQTRQQAVIIANKMFVKACDKGASDNVKSIYVRVRDEFEMASDEEYELLKRQIFSE